MRSVYKILFHINFFNKFYQDAGRDTNTDCEDGGTLGDLWALFRGGAESGDANSSTENDENTESNIIGPKGRMVRMMKRSIQENTRRNCTSRQQLVKKDRIDLVRIV